MSFNYEERLEILSFYDKHGLNAVLDHVRVQGIKLSKASVYRWLSVRKATVASYGGVSLLRYQTGSIEHCNF